MPDQLAEALRDRYTIERELGRGGMATVFLARDLKHQRLVALKVLRRELARTLGPERFQREIRFAARLQHPHILSVHDSGEAAGELWFTMPYVEGESLRARLTREGEVSIEVALRIAREAAQALQYAHEHGVIHRDIKPENLLLTTDGNTLVADFGIARALGDAGGPEERLTETGLSLGTPRYMSPEQASGEKTLDARTDVYSLACVLYEMLAGEPPFTGPTMQAITAKRLSGSVPSVRQVRPSVTLALDQALQRALAPVPADRFGSMAEFARALEPPQMPETVLSPVVPRRRRRWAVVLSCLAAGLAVLAWVWAAHRANRTGLDPKRVMVAVFANRTGNPMLDPVGLTAADYVNRGLVQTGLVEVVDVGVLYIQGVAPTGQIAEPRALARRNGAGIVVAGSYDEFGDSLVFQSTIIDVGSGRVLQALDPVRGPLARRELGLDALRQRVTVGLAELIDPRLSAIATPSPKPPNYAAYQTFVTAQGAFWRWFGGDALAGFRRAAALDSTFLTAAVWVAWAGNNTPPTGCSISDSVGRVLAPRRDELALLDRLFLDAALAECRGDYEAAWRIVQQEDPSLTHSAHFQMLRALYARKSGRPRTAVQILERLDPERDLGWLPDNGKVLYRRDIAVPYHALGDYRNELRIARDLTRKDPNRLASINLEIHALAGLGKTSDVLDRVARAWSLPPDPLMLYRLGRLTTGRRLPVNTAGRLCYEAALELQAHGHPDAAREAAERAVTWYHAQPAEDQSQPEYRYILARSLELLGRYREADSLMQKLAAEDSSNVDYQGTLGVLAVRLGDRARAQRIDQALAALTWPYLTGYHTYYRAQIAAVLGDRDRAVGLLRDAIAQGAAGDPWDHLHSEPAFGSLRDYPPFQELLRPKG
jgi:serine/threonine-protein kinase